MSLKNLSVTKKIPKLLRSKLNNKRIIQVYKKFEKSLGLNINFLVAVSGGPDSLALSFLAKIYSIKYNITAKFFIVDHKLRKGSTKEAKKVQQILKKNSIKAEILTWKGLKPHKGIQSAARNKRYKLLFDKCKELKINNILLGHHQDDLFENFFIRILRGSGLKGLVSLDKKSRVNNINLLRPLIDQKKEDLIFISKNIFNFFVEDPSNTEDKFLRIKIRKLIKELNNEGLDKKKFDKTIQNLKYTNEVVTYYQNKNLQKNSFYSLKKDKLILNEKFFDQPYEIVFRSFAEAIKIMGKKYYSSRGKKLDKIILKIKKNDIFKVTLGGCVIERVNLTVIISKEH
tara:strand:+ start:166 stop:1194 length:1029 start_codon:yes stop_codon:yes gene_type:complete